MKKATLIFWILILSWRVTFSQVQLQWAERYNGDANDWDTPLAIAVDDSGNVYVTGASPGIGTDRDYATLKYTSDGTLAWAQRYNGTTNSFDIGRDVLVDDSGNVFVTGGSVTLKFNTFGDSIWAVENNADCFRIQMNDLRQVYVAGVRFGDGIIKKMDSVGDTLWERAYNSPDNDLDSFNDIVLDSQGNIIVAGQSWGIGTQWDYLTIKYSPDGDTLWVRRYNGPALPIEVPTDIAFAITVDDSDNVYVTGWSDGVAGTPQCFTIKYSPSGDSLWGTRFPSAGSVGYVGYDILNDPSKFII